MDEPMDEDDSFHRPVPCSVPYSKPSVSQALSQAPPANRDSDPDSDDSFEMFAPTQSTGGSSGSVPSAESKGSMPPPVSNPRALHAPSTQRSVFKPTQPSTSGAPFSQLTTQRFGGPMTSTQTAPRPPVPFQPQTQMMTQNRIAIHPAVKTTRDMEMSQRTSSASSTSPSSPNSLARHRSANSGLRNANNNTPPIKTGTTMLVRRVSPDIRPSTPSGEVKMLRDQLDIEKHKCQKIQAEFQKDMQKNATHHKKELADRDELIKKQEKEIEMLRMAAACRKTASPTIIKNSVNSAIPSLNAEVKKVYPKIPSETGNLRRTPRRAQLPQKPISAFRHPLKEEDDDTFQMDDSFEPTATSTPKIPVVPRVGLRRPLNLESEMIDELNGAPTPKRIPVFSPERETRKREDLDEELRKIWETMDEGETISRKFFRKREDLVKEEQMEVDGKEDEWTDRYLLKQIKSIDFRKTTEKVDSAKARSKIQHQAEQKPTTNNSCGRCRIDERRKPESSSGSVKEWESMETERMDREKRTAEGFRSLQYFNVLQGVSRRGVDEFERASDQKEQAEKQYELTMQAVKKRTLEEIRDEKRESWRTDMMEELQRNGELKAVLDVPEEGRKEDCMWTSDSDDEDWMFPAPYDANKRTLCLSCSKRQRMMRRISKREREKRKVQTRCLQEFGVEQREMLRNMSILTKSKMEAADNELNRHHDELMMASRLFDDDDDMF